MVVNASAIEFPDNDPTVMLTHLDRWATDTITSIDAWATFVQRCDQWADYTPRNQVLLASYGIATPVAGPATWAQIPSTEADRPCAVRTGEHGLPVRVPITSETVARSDRTRVGARTGSVAGAYRWEAVFALEQLARRPASATIATPALPAALTGSGGEAAFTELVRHATGRLEGRTPRRVANPWEQLTVLAGRVPLDARRPELRPALARQAAWLTAARVGHTPGPFPTFDPTSVRARIRWELMLDTRRATHLLTRALSDAAGINLSASGIPRHDITDDRTTAPGRRNYLSPADVRALPLAIWTEVGPYTTAEWAGRGIPDAAGRGGFLRVTDTGYLAVYEHGDGARWRLETTRRHHPGLLAEGAAATFTEAQHAAVDATRQRFPQLATALRVPEPAATVFDPTVGGWRPLSPDGDDRQQRRQLDDHVAVIVMPGPGGRWQGWVQADTELRPLPLTASEAVAKEAVEFAGRRTMMQRAGRIPQQADQVIADLAASGTLTRGDLVEVLGHRLTDVDRTRLADTALAVDGLVEVLNAAGVLTPSTIVAVLAVEGASGVEVAGLVPTIGLAAPDAIRELNDRWELGRVEAAELVNATVEEMRDGGCTPAETLAVHPRQVLASLDARPDTWETAAVTMTEAGYPPATVVRHLANHAPTAELFAAAVTAVIDDPVDAFAYATRRGEAEQLARLAQAYGLDPTTTRDALYHAGGDPQLVVDVLTIVCDGDREIALALRGPIHELPIGSVDADRTGPLAAVGVGDVAAMIAALEPTASVDVSEAGTGALRAAVASLQLVGAADDLAVLRAAIAGVSDPIPTVPQPELDRRLARDLA